MNGIGFRLGAAWNLQIASVWPPLITTILKHQKNSPTRLSVHPGKLVHFLYNISNWKPICYFMDSELQTMDRYLKKINAKLMRNEHRRTVDHKQRVH